jgi:hypothetical protein
MHGGTHKHEHGNGEEHAHGGAAREGMDKDKLKAVLSYMRDHNKEHAQELRHLLGAIEDLGADEVTDLIENGVHSIESAAEQLGLAVELLEEV